MLVLVLGALVILGAIYAEPVPPEKTVVVLPKAVVQRPPDETVVVLPSPDGHTGTVGDPERNDLLSARRAERVKGFLIEIGIPGAQIQTAGRGERELLVPTADNIDEPRNRRVEINVR